MELCGIDATGIDESGTIAPQKEPETEPEQKQGDACTGIDGNYYFE